MSRLNELSQPRMKSIWPRVGDMARAERRATLSSPDGSITITETAEGQALQARGGGGAIVKVTSSGAGNTYTGDVYGNGVDEAATATGVSVVISCPHPQGVTLVGSWLMAVKVGNTYYADASDSHHWRIVRNDGFPLRLGTTNGIAGASSTFRMGCNMFAIGDDDEYDATALSEGWYLLSYRVTITWPTGAYGDGDIGGALPPALSLSLRADSFYGSYSSNGLRPYRSRPDMSHQVDLPLAWFYRGATEIESILQIASGTPSIEDISGPVYLGEISGTTRSAKLYATFPGGPIPYGIGWGYSVSMLPSTSGWLYFGKDGGGVYSLSTTDAGFVTSLRVAKYETDGSGNMVVWQVFQAGTKVLYLGSF